MMSAEATKSLEWIWLKSKAKQNCGHHSRDLGYVPRFEKGKGPHRQRPGILAVGPTLRLSNCCLGRLFLEWVSVFRDPSKSAPQSISRLIQHVFSHLVNHPNFFVIVVSDRFLRRVSIVARNLKFPPL